MAVHRRFASFGIGRTLKNPRFYGNIDKRLMLGGFNDMEAYKQEFIEFMLA